MRLIKEFNESINYLTEETKDPKKPNVFIEGVFLQSDLTNKNGRMYPKDIMRTEVNRYVRENVDTKRAYGELGHPEGPTVNLDRVSHMIVSLREDGNNWIGMALMKYRTTLCLPQQQILLRILALQTLLFPV